MRNFHNLHARARARFRKHIEIIFFSIHIAKFKTYFIILDLIIRIV
jgi:hypothetical protein